jgi:hypothetical protein
MVGFLGSTTLYHVYLFVYEFGFLKKTEHQTDQYVLVKWQNNAVYFLHLKGCWFFNF